MAEFLNANLFTPVVYIALFIMTSLGMALVYGRREVNWSRLGLIFGGIFAAWATLWGVILSAFVRGMGGSTFSDPNVWGTLLQLGAYGVVGFLFFAGMGRLLQKLFTGRWH